MNKNRIRLQLAPDVSSLLIKLAKETGESPTRFVVRMIFEHNSQSSGEARYDKGQSKAKM